MYKYSYLLTYLLIAAGTHVPHGITRRYDGATRRRGDHPAFTRALVLDLAPPGGMEG